MKALIPVALLFVASVSASALDVTLAWSPVEGVGGYVVYQAPSPAGPWTRAVVTSQTVATVVNASGSYFCVTSFYAAGESEPSFMVSTVVPKW